MPQATTPTEPSTTAREYQSTNRGAILASKPSSRLRTPLLAVATVLSSAIALIIAGAPRESSTDFSHKLPTLASVWQTPTQLQDFDLASNKRSMVEQPLEVGDEGFWLSRHDLASQTAGLVAIGDRISISEPPPAERALSQSKDGPAIRIFEVIELKPLSAPLLGVTTSTRTKGTPSSEQGAALTIVVCREQLSDATATGRVIRFLMETAPPGPVAGPTLPRTL